MMRISDVIFGDFDVTEPILLELLNSSEINRLKQISSGGYYPAENVYCNSEMSRWYHSVGVFLLLRRFNAPLEEQISGLIHDVSHSAFSHTIDYIKKDLEVQKQQSAQDSIHKDFIKNSSLKAIIEKHGFNLAYILEDSHFPLKENNLPDICADRLDYTLRQAYIYNLCSLSEIHHLVDALQLYNGSFVFSDLTAAQRFSRLFAYLNDNCWSDISSAVMFSVSAQLFRHAIAKNYVSFSDFYHGNDQYILQKILPHLDSDSELNSYHHLLTLAPDNFENDLSLPGEAIFIKNRVVNPYLLHQGELKRVSELDIDYQHYVEQMPKFKQYHVKLKKLSQAV